MNIILSKTKEWNTFKDLNLIDFIAQIKEIDNNSFVGIVSHEEKEKTDAVRQNRTKFSTII